MTREDCLKCKGIGTETFSVNPEDGRKWKCSDAYEGQEARSPVYKIEHCPSVGGSSSGTHNVIAYHP